MTIATNSLPGQFESPHPIRRIGERDWVFIVNDRTEIHCPGEPLWHQGLKAKNEILARTQDSKATRQLYDRLLSETRQCYRANSLTFEPGHEEKLAALVEGAQSETLLAVRDLIRLDQDHNSAQSVETLAYNYCSESAILRKALQTLANA